MTYLVTGGTGFIGRYLVRQLARRGRSVYVVVRPQSMDKFEALKAWWGDAAKHVVALAGDLGEPSLGLSPARRAALKGKVAHFFHLGAVYDLSASAESMETANIRGTENALQLAGQIAAGHFHLVSSIASAGLYDGVFDEEMFEEAERLEHPYFRTKHDSEALVRSKCPVPWRVYRPAMVVGDSQTGHIDKIDGPYYLFKLIQKTRQAVPPWFPMIGLEGGYLNVVPVDYVVAALDVLAHAEGQDGRCFHLVDPKARHVGDVLNVFAKAAHAPTATVRLDMRLVSYLPELIKAALAAVRPLQRIADSILHDLGIPRSVMQFLAYPTRFDNRRARALLEPAGVRLPPLEDYAWRLWDYWERNLDPDLFIDRSLGGAVRGKLVLITGGSSGIGRATVRRLAESGARVIVVARDAQKLEETRVEIESLGGWACTYSVDLSDAEAIGALAKRVLEEHGAVDILINNAGHSIRRSLEISYERFFDYERLMRINYLAPVRLTLGLLPAMVERRHGQVINISSIGVLSNSPRFSAYVASKAALEAFSRSAGAEVCGRGVQFTIVNFPLVRTPMIAPTKIYEHLPTISPEEATEMVVDAIIHRPVRVATRLGIFAQILHMISPKISQLIMNTGYQMFPDSSAAKGAKDGRDPRPPQEGIALTALLKGLHW